MRGLQNRIYYLKSFCEMFEKFFLRKRGSHLDEGRVLHAVLFFVAVQVDAPEPAGRLRYLGVQVALLATEGVREGVDGVAVVPLVGDEVLHGVRLLDRVEHHVNAPRQDSDVLGRARHRERLPGPGHAVSEEQPRLA